MRKPWWETCCGCWVCHSRRTDRSVYKDDEPRHGRDSYNAILCICREARNSFERESPLRAGPLSLLSSTRLHSGHNFPFWSGYLPYALHGMSSGRRRGHPQKLPAFSGVAASCWAIGGFDPPHVAWAAWPIGARWENLQRDYAFVARRFDR